MLNNVATICLTTLTVVLLSAGLISPADGQGIGLNDLAVGRGFRFGFEISPENLVEPQSTFRDVVAAEAGVGTMTHFWHLPGSENADVDVTPDQSGKIVLGKYDFSRPLRVARFCIENGIDTHGAPVLWAQDQYTPPWVLQQPSSARMILENHVKQIVGVLGRQVTGLGGRVHTYHVVNEAFDYNGQLIASYWKTNLGVPRSYKYVPSFVEIAFRTAAKSDPRANLIYNDYGQEEINSQKFDAIMRMFEEMIKNRIPIHGMGWQLHVTANQVLSPGFPLERRMNAVAALGLSNYITELDVVMDDRNQDGSLPDPPADGYTEHDLLRQKLAYKKITEIFARVNRRAAMQVWGVYDVQSWLGADRRPLLFDEQLAKKPAYFGVLEALKGEISGARGIRHALTHGQLRPPSSGGEDADRVTVEFSPWLQALNANSTIAPQWYIDDPEEDGSYRIQAMTNARYLHVSDDRLFPIVATNELAPEDPYQQWYLTHWGGGYFLILNAGNNMFLSPQMSSRNPLATTSNLWILGLWQIQ